ncbi:filamentous hemagglutinin family protein [Achromobacter insuavis]
MGNVTLAPTAPSTGAGIATLAPIAEVPAGDVDLIAPLGTIDAGEAGIRVSGNVNVAALHVVNAANIQVQGDSKGIPVTAVVNTGALSSASAASSAASGAAQDSVRAPASNRARTSPRSSTCRSWAMARNRWPASARRRSRARPPRPIAPTAWCRCRAWTAAADAGRCRRSGKSRPPVMPPSSRRRAKSAPETGENRRPDSFCAAFPRGRAVS